MLRAVASIYRKVIYRLYPTSRQEAAMRDALVLHQQLYNAALEQRIAAWRLRRRHLTYADQCRDLTALRHDDSRYAALNAQSAQVTLKRLDQAFRGFFRRLRAGQKPGFPRFKSLERFSGWGYNQHGKGFRFISNEKNRHGKLRLSGIGAVTIRGRARTPGNVVTCEVQHKGDRWYASLTLVCEPKRVSGTEAVGLDWGVETFATLAHEDGAFTAIANPHFVRRAKAKLEAAQRRVSAKRHGSENFSKAKRAVVAIHRKIRNRRRDFHHKKSASIIASASLIATESLAIKNLTATAKGTIESPGRNVAQKSALNREILSTAPSAFLAMLRYKAEEAGIHYVEIPTRSVKPSQRCSACWSVRKKDLSMRWHECACGEMLARDENAARVSLFWALINTGWGPAGCLTIHGEQHEAPPPRWSSP